MRIQHIFGKLTQLRRLPPAWWPAFISGWLNRQKNGRVPCALAGCQRLAQVPLKDFYETYGYFCEHPAGCRELGYFLKKIKSREVFYDIGAFRGAYSTAVKQQLQAAVSLHVFEPMPKNAAAVRRIFELNHFNDFKINELAVNDGGQLSGSVNEQDDMLRFGDIKAGAPAKFAAVSLDEYIARGNPAPTLVKIDVEGFEMQVLQGARDCLAKNHPRLWVEVHPGFIEQQGLAATAVIDFLRQAGYVISFFDDYNPNHEKTAFHIWCE